MLTGAPVRAAIRCSPAAPGTAASSYFGGTARRSGTSQIWRKCTGSVAEALYSEWITPAPALIFCTRPGRMTPSPPLLSRCASPPETT